MENSQTRERTESSAMISSTNVRVRQHVLREQQFTDDSIPLQIVLEKSKIEVFVSCALIIMAVVVSLATLQPRTTKEVFFKPVTVVYLVVMWFLCLYPEETTQRNR